MSGLAKQVLEQVIAQGIVEFCLCPSSRNAPLVYPLVSSPQVRLYYWPEERSAAFFALGRMKATGTPVAVVTTSGTAVAELLAATMEAYYTGLPLVLLTADRPRRFRGTGAPQSAEQVGIFGCYVEEMHDLAEGETCSLDRWTRRRPIHLNLCFEEPKDVDCQAIRLDRVPLLPRCPSSLPCNPDARYLSFVQKVRFPFVVVGALPQEARAGAIAFLRHLQAPVYLEAISGIRESPLLQPLRITRIENLWHTAAQSGYPIDGVLRIGGVPTARLWRDLEYKEGQIAVCSVSEQPFSGLSCAGVIHTSLAFFFDWARGESCFESSGFQRWQEVDQAAQRELEEKWKKEPRTEMGLVRALSERIPVGSKIYLGNSLPIREWDQAATYEPRGFQVACSRGVNGIDGQWATFLGYSSMEQDNWTLLGDLTVLYDLVAPWITAQIADIPTNVVLINNGGAGIFARMFAHPAFQNRHTLNFEPLAEFWRWRYERWESVPSTIAPSQGGRLIELIPESSQRFL